MQSNEETHPHQYSKPNNNDLLTVNNLLTKYKRKLPQNSGYFCNTYQSRKHALYVTVQRTNNKPNFPGIAITHTQRTSFNSSSSNTFSQPKPNADISSPSIAVSHRNNKNSRYWSTILQYIPYATHAGGIIIYLHYDRKWEDQNTLMVKKLTTT